MKNQKTIKKGQKKRDPFGQIIKEKTTKNTTKNTIKNTSKNTTKREFEPTNKKVIPVEETKNVLEIALQDQKTVDIKQLTQGLGKLQLDAAKRSDLANVLAKSLIDKTVALLSMISTLEEEREEDEVSGIVIEVLQSFKQKKGENSLLALVKDKNILAVIASKKVGKQLDTFLTEKDLVCLIPVPDLTDDVSKFLSEGKPPNEILSFLQSKVDSKLNLSKLALPVLSHVLKEMEVETKAPKLDAIDKYVDLLKRVVGNDRETEVKMIYTVLNATERDVLKSVFAKLCVLKICSVESFLDWRDDTKLSKESKETQQKKKAVLVKVNDWLSEIETALKKEQEGEDHPDGEASDDEGVEDEEEEEDEFLVNPNLEFFKKKST